MKNSISPSDVLHGFLRKVRIAHHIRGRVRLRLDASADYLDVPKAEARAFQSLLDRTPGVRSVQVNLLARSCIVHYDPEIIPERAWSDLLDGRVSDAAEILEHILRDTYVEIGNAKP
jgi:hypothetical protein